MPYTAFQSFIDPLAPKGYRSYWRGEYLKNLSEEIGRAAGRERRYGTVKNIVDALT
jgi:hypothetical protein